MKNPYGRSREIETAADLGMDVQSDSLSNLFACAAWQLFKLMTDPEDLQTTTTLHVNLWSDSLETLLVDWLNELIFLVESRSVFLCRFVVEIQNHNLKAVVCGESIDCDRHVRKTGIKAATYHDLTLRITGEGYRARVILDV